MYFAGKRYSRAHSERLRAFERSPIRLGVRLPCQARRSMNLAVATIIGFTSLAHIIVCILALESGDNVKHCTVGSTRRVITSNLNLKTLKFDTEKLSVF